MTSIMIRRQSIETMTRKIFSSRAVRGLLVLCRHLRHQHDRRTAMSGVLVVSLLAPAALAPDGHRMLPPEQSGSAAQAPTPAKMVEIDGHKTPWLIPDYVAWEWLFRLIGRRNQIESFRGAMGRMPGLTEEDRSRLYEAADAYDRHVRDCSVRREAKIRELAEQRASPATSDQLLRDLTLTCRQETLALADRLMDTVADSSRIAIEDLLKQGRASMTVRMAESEVAFFRLPR